MLLKHLRAPAALATSLLVSASALADYHVDILPPGSPMGIGPKGEKSGFLNNALLMRSSASPRAREAALFSPFPIRRIRTE